MTKEPSSPVTALPTRSLTCRSLSQASTRAPATPCLVELLITVPTMRYFSSDTRDLLASPCALVRAWICECARTQWLVTVQPKLKGRTIFLSVCKVKQKLVLLSYG